MSRSIKRDSISEALMHEDNGVVGLMLSLSELQVTLPRQPQATGRGSCGSQDPEGLGPIGIPSREGGELGRGKGSSIEAQGHFYKISTTSM